MNCRRFLIFLIITISIVNCDRPKKEAEKKSDADSLPNEGIPQAVYKYQKTKAGNPIVFIKTTKGDIEIEVFENDAPNYASNFIRLVRNGFYDNLTFHKIISDTMIVTGDPKGDGSGSPGYFLDREKTPYSNKSGFVGMVPTDDGRVNGSQFYILANDRPSLDSSVNCFAKVISGFEFVEAISRTPTQNGKPVGKIKLMEALLKPIETNVVDADTTN